MKHANDTKKETAHGLVPSLHPNSDNPNDGFKIKHQIYSSR